MPLITGKSAVQAEYQRAAERGWVLPTFNTENQTGLEAILAAAKTKADALDCPDLPIITGLTNTYWHRAQSLEYTQVRDWRLGLRMFLDDVDALCSADSPYRDLHVMVHLDHVQWDSDAELLADDAMLARVSSIMYDASTLPFDENIQRTATFVDARGEQILIEGACDEIPEATEEGESVLTTPEMAERYLAETGVDIIVANLGTEHRASARDLQYHGDVARAIRDRVGPCICLHGTSSVSPEQVRNLFNDGICKVNVWTALERDSTPALLEGLLRHADKVVGSAAARQLAAEGLLGPRAPVDAPASVTHFTTAYRQRVVHTQMQRVVGEFLDLWYS